MQPKPVTSPERCRVQKERKEGGGAVYRRDLLEQAIENSGLRRRYIVEQLDMAYASFNSKLSGKVEWKTPEVHKLCKILHINKTDMLRIFFAEESNKVLTEELT